MVLGLWPPSDAVRDQGPLFGRLGRALATLFEVEFPSPYDSLIGRGNLYPDAAAIRSNEERRPPAAAALGAFERLAESNARVIVLGVVVAHAFDLDDWMTWRYVRPSNGRLRAFAGGLASGSIVAASLPSPTDRNGWWADPGNAARARAFCRGAMKGR